MPPFPATPVKKKSGSMLPVIIGVVVALLLGGAAVAFLFLREPAETTAEAPTASSSADQAAPTGSAQGDTTEASDTGSAAASDADAGSDDAGAEPEKVELELSCKPDCDQILVDNEKIDLEEHKKNDNKLSLLPGKHTLEARKAGYITRKETIEIEAGKPTKKEILMRRPRKRQPKPCGQFLNPCR